MPKLLQQQLGPDSPEVLPNLADLTPEQMQNLTPEQQKEMYEWALENERRKQKEMYQDIGYERGQKRKL